MSYDVIASQPIVIDNVGRRREMEIPLYHSPSTLLLRLCRDLGS